MGFFYGKYFDLTSFDHHDVSLGLLVETLKRAKIDLIDAGVQQSGICAM